MAQLILGEQALTSCGRALSPSHRCRGLPAACLHPPSLSGVFFLALCNPSHTLPSPQFLTMCLLSGRVTLPILFFIICYCSYERTAGSLCFGLHAHSNSLPHPFSAHRELVSFRFLKRKPTKVLKRFAVGLPGKGASSD